MHINDIPVELLSEIFEFSTVRGYLTNNNLAPFLQSFRPSCSPFNLIQVCQHWRRVAFSTVTLWTYLSGVQWKPSRTSIPEMAYWLQRSRDAPLHFRISSRGDHRKPSFDPQHARRMLRLFADHLHRWQSLSIEAGVEIATDLATLLRNAGDNLPPLTGLEVELEYEKVPQSVVDELISRISLLKDLHRLYWINWRYGCSLPDLPWGQYSTVSVQSSFTVEESVVFLARCVSATSVTLHGWRNPVHCLMSFNPCYITLKHLTALTLDKSSDPLSILSHFILPSLRCLEIGLYQRDFRVLEDFLKRSNCRLRDLIVIDTNMQAQDITVFFKFPWLKPIANVKLGPTHDVEAMLQLLNHFAGADLLLPPLAVWKEGTIDWPLFLGWKESGLRGVQYLYEAGKVIHHTAFLESLSPR